MMEVSPAIGAGAGIGYVLGMIIAVVAGLGALICGIMVAVKIMNKEGTGLGVLAIILAIFCGIATLVWGWVKRADYGITTKLMTVYTICFLAATVGGIIANVAVMGAWTAARGAAGETDFERMMEDAANRPPVEAPQ